MEQDEYNDACAAVWNPVRALAIEGTWKRNVFDQGRFVDR